MKKKLIQNSNLESKIFVAGHKGMVGSSIVKRLKHIGYKNLVLREKKELDLTNQSKVNNFFLSEKIDQVYVAAAKVGGIYSNNSYPADFIYYNLMIECNLIHSAFIGGVKNLLFLGSSCIYPRNSSQPITETELMKGALETTNEPYSIAKIAGIKLCESYNRQYGATHGIDYRSIMPTNLYGPKDNYDEMNSHVIPALIRRFHEAKALKKDYVTVWGSGMPRREFLYVEDLANACVHIMSLSKSVIDKYTEPMCSHINVGSGEEYSISELSKIIASVIGFKGDIKFDSSKPDGTPRKILNSNKINQMGWKSNISLKEGLKIAYEDFLKKNKNNF